MRVRKSSVGVLVSSFLSTSEEHETHLFYCFRIILTVNARPIENNVILHKLSINLNTMLETVTAAPASTNIAVPSIPQDRRSFENVISQSEAHDKLTLYLAVSLDSSSSQMTNFDKKSPLHLL